MKPDWQRSLNQLVFLLLAGLFFIGAGAISLANRPAEDSESSGLPFLSQALPAANPTADSVEIVARADISQVPILTDRVVSPKLNPVMNLGQKPEHALVTYEVQRGDTPNRIAEKFNIKSETLLGGNPELSQESSLLQAGYVLTILPVDGVLHEVALGDTLEGIANQYGIPVEDIIAYEPNKLEFPYRLYKGTQILVPGAVRELFVWTPPKLPARQRGQVVGTGTFTRAVNSGCVTQFYWAGHPGLDIALAEGSPVYAMDTGTVSYASWAAGGYYDYGNLIVIDHGNGYETFYAHLSGINVYPGQVVRQGALIGASGNTGRSSGPHIHIEIRLNNFRDDPTFYTAAPRVC